MVTSPKSLRWSTMDDGSALDCLQTLEKLQMNGLMLDLEPGSENHTHGVEEDKMCPLFDQLVSVFLKNVCGAQFVRPLPPSIGNGKSVNFYKLYLVVRQKGGYEYVTKKSLWESVAKSAGNGSGHGCTLKLIYAKYLDALDKWLQKVQSEGGLSSQCNMLLSETTDLGSLSENQLNRKRKRECDSGFLDWVKKVAKDPCDLAVESLPVISKWKSNGTEELWKQVLIAREKMLVKRTDLSVSQSAWKQKMHAFMYEDQNGSNKSRSSQRIRSAKELLYMKSSPSSPGLEFKQKVLIGQSFQAKIPDFTPLENYEFDPKWLGTFVWLPENQEHRKTGRIGKGRSICCGCDLPGSIQCVKFHISEERLRVKIEIGSAFKQWKFDKMGEEVALSWTKSEEKKFLKTVKPNELFWDDLSDVFPRKKRRELVSYYFNVFLVKRRRYQNQLVVGNINSDDDEPEIGFESDMDSIKFKTNKSSSVKNK